MRTLLILLVLLAASAAAWCLDYDTTGIYQVAVRTVDIPTLPGGSTSNMSNSKIYYPSDGGSAVAPGAVPCPIVVFGHGFFIGIDQYASYGQHLASWGYVVVVPTISNPFPTPSHYGRAIDMKAAAKYTAGLDTVAGDIFYNKLDRWTWAFAGHSMGGSIACLAADTLKMLDTLKCVVSFSGPQSSPATHPQHIAQPLLIMEGTEDQIAPWDEVYNDFYRYGTQPASFAVIDGANHSQFTDSWTSPFGDGTATISRGLQRRYARRHLIAWLERYLKGWRTPVNYHCCFGDSINGHAAMADTVASRYQNLPPLQTSLLGPLDCAALGDDHPLFSCRCYDDADQLGYWLYLDDQPSLSSPESLSAGNGPSGAIVQYAPGQGLASGMVWYWAARAKDQHGQTGPCSQVRSLAIDTSFPPGSGSWRQSRAGQFSSDLFENTILSGDSVVLADSVGWLTGGAVDFGDLSALGSRAGWGYLRWLKASAEDSIGTQVLYQSGDSWLPVPDAVLPGNSQGFYADSSGGVVALDMLDTLIYRQLRIKAIFIAASKSIRPALLCWELGSPIAAPMGVGEGVVSPATGSIAGIRWASPPGCIPLGFELRLTRWGEHALGIYNLVGQRVRRLNLGPKGPGLHLAQWDATDDRGRRVASGIYIARLETDCGLKAAKAVVIR